MTGQRLGMVMNEARPSRYAHWRLLAILLIAVTATQAYANQPPVADAGPSRYAGDEPIVIDGAGSYDPDPGDMLTYQWIQTSGPTVVLSNTDTATPSMTATLTGNVEIVELELTVTDTSQATSSDTIQITLVSDMPPAENRFRLGNCQPFDLNKPTFVFFNGGNCVTGGAGSWGDSRWCAKANNIRTPAYMPGPIGGYYSFGNALIVFLSSIAPTYDQPIETAGYSTGGMPAMDAAIQMNRFQDSRYNVTRVSLLDGACDKTYHTRLLLFGRNPVAGEPAWVINYYSTHGTFRDGAFNVRVPGEHWTPGARVWDSIDPNYYPTADPYNHGVVAGAFLSVVGPGKNYNVPMDATSSYLFYWDSAGVRYLDRGNFPGALPEPVTLIGPTDGTVANPTGATLGCEISEHAVAYQLLWGQDKHNLQVVYEKDGPLSIPTGPLPPGQVFYWTIKVSDPYGTTIHADPRALIGPAGLQGDFNGDGQLDSTDCAIIKSAMNTTWGAASFVLAADLDGDGLVTCLDADIWLTQYREFLQDPSAPDPCGLKNTTDTDGDGVRDLCDNCPTANADQADSDNDGLGDVCDNCPSLANADQTDADGDALGNVCDDDNDGDGRIDLWDNCPDLANSDQADADRDLIGDVCDHCPNDWYDDADDDGLCGDIDICPNIYNPNQEDEDADNIGDVCDPCLDDPDNDIDTDGFCRNDDNCPTITNPGQEDFDNDGIGDPCDDDRDGDGLLNTADNCPTIPNSDQADDEGDGVGDVCDICPKTLPGVPVDEDGCSALSVPGDINLDGDVDMQDYARLQACLSGQSIPQTDPDCENALLDGDADVDMIDLFIFKLCVSGADIPADANCVE